MAITKDDLWKLRDASARYLKFKGVRDKAVAKMEKERDICLAVFEKIKRNAVRFAEFKSSRTENVRVVWDALGLHGFLKEKLNKKVANSVVKLAVDEKVLDKLVSDGDVTLEELGKFVESTRKWWTFKVSEVEE